MIPYILGIMGGYLIGLSQGEPKKLNATEEKETRIGEQLPDSPKELVVGKKYFIDENWSYVEYEGQGISGNPSDKDKLYFTGPYKGKGKSSLVVNTTSKRFKSNK